MISDACENKSDMLAFLIPPFIKSSHKLSFIKLQIKRTDSNLAAT